MESTRPTRAEINLASLRHNFNEVRKLAGNAKILAVVKAEAYGHGIVRIAHELAGLGVDYFGVSFLEEGILLRETGISTPILVMGGLVEEQIERFLDFNIDITVSSVWKAKQVDTVASRHKRKATAHLKFDTGMGRVGQNWGTAGLLLSEVARLKHIELSGIYSHFASAESENTDFTHLQLDRFVSILENARKIGLEFPLVHMANSGALLQLGSVAHFSMVRPGLLLYGYAPARYLEKKTPVSPVMTLRSNVVYVKKSAEGTPIGYGSTWRSPGNCWIATIPIGYGDGYPRRAGNRATVLLRGNPSPIVGNVSMDQITVNAGKEAYLGDDTILFGNCDAGKLSLWELCDAIDAIPYELLCGLTARVPRIYVE